MLRICFVSKKLPVHQLGGMEHHALTVCTELARRGNKVSVLTSKHPNGLEYERLDENLEFFYLKSIVDKNQNEFQNELPNIYRNLHAKLHFDVIFSESGSAKSLVKDENRDIPAVCLVHGFKYNNVIKRWRRGDLKGKLSAIKAWFKIKRIPVKKRFTFLCDWLITISDKNRIQYLQENPNLKNRISLVYNGIDTERFKPSKSNYWTEKLKIKSQHVLTYTGRLTRAKGIHIILRTLPFLKETFPDIQFLIAGTGDFEDHLKEIVNELDLNRIVHFLGYIENKHIPEILNCTDVFTFTTLAIEGLPYNVIEALSCGCFVIGSDSEGVDELIEDGVNGFLVNPRNTDEIIRKITSALQNTEQSQKIRQKARESAVQKFSIDSMINGILQVLEEVKMKSD